MKTKHRHLKDRFDSIDLSLRKAQSFTGEPEIAAYLSGYLVVMICGIYEDCLEYLMVERASSGGDAEVQNFVKITLANSFRNPTFGTLVGALNKFSPTYGEAIQRQIKKSAREALDSIVENKNSIAHGKSISVTIGDVVDYHSRSIVIFEATEQLLASPAS